MNYQKFIEVSSQSIYLYFLFVINTKIKLIFSRSIVVINRSSYLATKATIE